MVFETKAQGITVIDNTYNNNSFVFVIPNTVPASILPETPASYVEREVSG